MCKMYYFYCSIYLFSVIETFVTSAKNIKMACYSETSFFFIFIHNLLFYVKSDKKYFVLKMQALYDGYRHLYFYKERKHVSKILCSKLRCCVHKLKRYIFYIIKEKYSQ